MPSPSFPVAVLIMLAPLPFAPAALAQSSGFTRVSDAGEARIDGLRDGLHEGVPVRFLDMTVRNTSGDISFPDTIQKVWWQGRTSGDKAEPLHRRGLRQRGMYENMKPGAVWEVTYIIPRREDVLGVTITDPAERSTANERLRTWDELRGGTPARAASAAPATAAKPARRAEAADTPSSTPSAGEMIGKAGNAVARLPAPVRRKLAPAAARLTDALKRKLPGLDILR